MAQYDSFILRVWRSTGDDGSQWAGRLEHLQQGQSWSFGSLEELLEHLRNVADGGGSTVVSVLDRSGPGIATDAAGTGMSNA